MRKWELLTLDIWMTVVQTEGFEILYYFHVKRVTGADRSHVTLGSETKNFVTCATASSMRLMFLLVHLTPQVPWSDEEVGSDRFCTYSGYVSQRNDLRLN